MEKVISDNNLKPFLSRQSMQCIACCFTYRNSNFDRLANTVSDKSVIALDETVL